MFTSGQTSNREPRTANRESRFAALSRTANERIAGSSGFTLIELLVVISMISILAAMGIAQYRNSVRRAEEATLKTDLFQMRDAIDQYYADKGKYPATLEALVSDGYIRKIPIDPITKAADTWETVPAEADPGNPSAEPGVYNVKSGATGTSMEGNPYSEW
jgi:prepilin-type N-terminal cleavage/methylation domain-containing protein